MNSLEDDVVEILVIGAFPLVPTRPLHKNELTSVMGEDL